MTDHTLWVTGSPASRETREPPRAIDHDSVVAREFRIWAETTNIDVSPRGTFAAGFAAGVARAPTAPDPASVAAMRGLLREIREAVQVRDMGGEGIVYAVIDDQDWDAFEERIAALLGPTPKKDT